MAGKESPPRGAAKPSRSHPFTVKEALAVITRGITAGAAQPRELEERSR